jgi:hypothetical protein
MRRRYNVQMRRRDRRGDRRIDIEREMEGKRPRAQTKERT